MAAGSPVRVLGGVALTVLLLSGSACTATRVGQSPEIPAKYENRETGAARLLADVTGRIVGIINVTDDYPDPDRTFWARRFSLTGLSAMERREPTSDSVLCWSSTPTRTQRSRPYTGANTAPTCSWVHE